MVDGAGAAGDDSTGDRPDSLVGMAANADEGDGLAQHVQSVVIDMVIPFLGATIVQVQGPAILYGYDRPATGARQDVPVEAEGDFAGYRYVGLQSHIVRQVVVARVDRTALVGERYRMVDMAIIGVRRVGHRQACTDHAQRQQGRGQQGAVPSAGTTGSVTACHLRTNSGGM